MTTSAPQRTEAQLAAIRAAARREIARRSFPDFLTHVQIRSDDPLNPRPVPMVAFPYQLDLADRWQRHESNVILKRRQVGASVLLRAYCLWRAWAGGWAIGYYSRGQDESVAWLNGVEDMVRDLPAFLRVQVKRSGDYLTVGTGSIRAFPGTQRAGISYTFQLIVADEAAHHTYGRENYANYGPAIGAGGQFICLSTADPALGPTGWFWEMVEQARAGGPYAFVFVDRWARPDQQAEWWDREAARYTDERIQSANYPLVPEDAFQGREGLVYPMFDPQRHIRGEYLRNPVTDKPDPTLGWDETTLDPVPWSSCLRRYYSIDLGGNDPTAVPVGGVYRRAGEGIDRIHIYDALYVPQGVGAPTYDVIEGYLLGWHALAPFFEGEGDPASGGESLTSTLRGAGLPGRRGKNDRVEGIDLVAMYLTHGWLTFSGEIAAIVRREMASYRWAEKTDPHSRERYATRTPVDHHGDMLDAVRLLVMGAYYDSHNDQPGRPAYSGVRV